MFSKLSALRPARRTLSVCRPCRAAMLSRSKSMRGITHGESLRSTEGQADRTRTTSEAAPTRSSLDSTSKDAKKRKDVLDREKFRRQVEAVTEAAEAASMESKETFFVGPFVFLPLNGKRVRYHKAFLRDACKSISLMPLHLFASDSYMLWMPPTLAYWSSKAYTHIRSV